MSSPADQFDPRVDETFLHLGPLVLVERDFDAMLMGRPQLDAGVTCRLQF